MATPQWVLLQRRIEPSEKSLVSQYELNARKRQKQAVKSAVRKGLLKHLDQQMILESARDSEVEEVNQIKYISLPSSAIQSIDELSILSFSKLTVVNLPYNYITDIKAFHSCVNLLKFDVSGNQISCLPGSDFWASLVSLKILYLNNNIINSKESLLSLGHCTSLQVLTMYDNPVSIFPNYRHVAVNCILSLKALDYHIISDQEIIQNLQLSGKFRSYAKPFHTLLYSPVDKNDSLKDDLQKINKLLLTVDTVLAHHSPVIIIQRWIRGWLTRCRLLRSNDSQIRDVVQYRQRGPEYTNRIIRLSVGTPLEIKRQLSRLGTSELPLPPPSSPIPVTLKPQSYDNKQLWRRPMNKELQKTMKETKEILTDSESQHKAKNRRMKGRRHQSKMKSDTTATVAGGGGGVLLMIHGEHQSASEINKMEYVKDMRKRDAEEIREAQEDIKAVVEDNRTVRPVPRQTHWPKDAHAFMRAHATMSLAMLKDIAKKDHKMRKENEVSRKAETVARVREDREIRRSKVRTFQQTTKDAIEVWKIDEERRLLDKKEQMELEKEMSLLKTAENVGKMLEETKHKKEKREFALLFGQQHNMLNRLSHKEEMKLMKKSFEDSQKEKVESSRLTAQEQADIVNRFMHLRSEKMRSENCEEKEKLDAQMIQLASQKLMERKQKVAKVKAWRKIAKSLTPAEKRGNDIATTTNDLSDLLDTIPEADVVDVGLLGPLLKAYTSAGLNSGYSPFHMRRTSNKSHHTWQRGRLVMDEDGRGHHLPVLPPLSELQPLMYDQLQPTPYLRSVGTTPNNSYHNTPLVNNPLRGTSPLVIEAPPDMHLIAEMDGHRLIRDNCNT